MVSKIPPASPAAIMLQKRSLKTFGCFLRASARVESGSTLADALRRHPKVFNDLFCNMIAAGEAGGILDTILQRMSSYIEKRVKLQAAVRSAMIYPAAVVTIAVGVVIVILWKVIPTF